MQQLKTHTRTTILCFLAIGFAMSWTACNDSSTSSSTTYTVTPSGDGNETLSPSSAQTVKSGATQAIAVTAKSGYIVSTTVGGSCTAGSWSGTTYTTGAITTNCTITFTATSSAGTLAINANETTLQTVTTSFESTTRVCNQVSRNTSSCQSAREALGLSGNWLDFSCNVVLGLATSSGVATTTYADATYVTLTSPDLPDYTSNYYPTTGSYNFTAYDYTVAGLFDSMYVAFSTAFPDPNSIGNQSIVMSVPINPTEAVAESQTMAGGGVGMAINGVIIYDSVAGNTDNIFSEDGSFDQCDGHPDQASKYHYHSEPYSISYQDNKLIGVMRDGFFIYGRNDYNGSTPGTTANIETAGSSSTIYVYGGDVGVDPVTGTGNSFHYHLTEWEGCYHESMGVKSNDDGETDDTLNTPSGSCGGTWVDAWFITGHGNGGTYMTLPSGLAGQAPSQTKTATRYYYGTPGSCTNC